MARFAVLLLAVSTTLSVQAEPVTSLRVDSWTDSLVSRSGVGLGSLWAGGAAPLTAAGLGWGWSPGPGGLEIEGGVAHVAYKALGWPDSDATEPWASVNAWWGDRLGSVAVGIDFRLLWFAHIHPVTPVPVLWHQGWGLSFLYLPKDFPWPGNPEQAIVGLSYAFDPSPR